MHAIMLANHFKSVALLCVLLAAFTPSLAHAPSTSTCRVADTEPEADTSLVSFMMTRLDLLPAPEGGALLNYSNATPTGEVLDTLKRWLHVPNVEFRVELFVLLPIFMICCIFCIAGCCSFS
mmetsp:Transcript_142334/g.258749  ORF Transcript_142334/g.258749 Transcript_142334/m.258749 type:complete len:122 (-) Transcript_142334:254-619(-)